jgi:hypothetical protein
MNLQGGPTPVPPKQTDRRSIYLNLLIALLGMQGTVRTAEAASRPPFEFHDFIWVNIHHYLYNEAFPTHQPGAGQAIEASSAPERAQIATAIEFYRAHYTGRDLLFDDELPKITARLIAAQNSDKLPHSGIPADLRRTLESVYPIYKSRLWPAQSAENEKWIAHSKDLMSQYGSAVQARLEAVLQREFSDGPYQVYAVHEANWAGGYTFRPAHTIVSSGRPDYAGPASLEMVFHESLHAGPFDEVQAAIDEEFARQHAKDDLRLGHAVLFYSAGEAVHEVLKQHGIDYEQFVYKNGVFSHRDWKVCDAAIREYWLPYMEGHGEMKDAISRMVGYVIANKPTGH